MAESLEDIEEVAKLTIQTIIAISVTEILAHKIIAIFSIAEDQPKNLLVQLIDKIWANKIHLKVSL